MVHITKKQNGKSQAAVAKAEAEAKVVNDAPQVDVSAARESKELNELRVIIGKGDKVISDFTSGILVKKNEVEAAPVGLLSILLETYCQPDNDGNPTIPLSQFFPRPVAKAEDEAGSNAPHKEFFEAPKPDATGQNWKPRKCNYFTEAWSDTATGKAQDFVIKQCSIMLDKDGDHSKVEQKYREMPIDKVANLKKKTANDKSRGRQLLRRAVAIWYVLDEIAEYGERVILEYDSPGDMQALLSTQYPMNLIDVKRTRVNKPMKVSDIIRLDVTRAAKEAGPNGSLYDKLIDQLSRGAGEKSGDGTRFTNAAAMFTAVDQFNNWFDVDSDDGALHQTDLLKSMAQKTATSDLLVEKWGTFYRNVRATWTEELQKRYEKIIAKQLAAAAVDESAA